MSSDKITHYHNQNSPNIDPRVTARALYWQGWRISSIGRHLGIKPATVHSWKQRENWDGNSPMQRIESSIEARLIQLIYQEKKSDAAYKEIKHLQNALINFKTANTVKVSNQAAPENQTTATHAPEAIPNPDNKSVNIKITEKEPKYNYFNEQQLKRVQEIHFEQMFAYQRVWHDSGKKARVRNILKSRQIGATFYFAREALIDALITGRNQVFMSASRAQAYQFKMYICDLAEMVDVTMRGDIIKLENSGAKLFFLGTNSRTAQGRTGNLYLDEYFWIPKFTQLRELTGPIAQQKQYRKTYFSTPSTEDHEAFSFWTGEDYNLERPKSQHIHLDVSHQALMNPRLDPDGQTRQIVTLDDAERGGCNLFDREQIEKEYSPSTLDQLFNCVFIKNDNALFEYSLLTGCAVDSWEKWQNFYRPTAPRPCGNTPAWIGYDPTDDSDAAGLVVAIPPLKANDPFRIIERIQLYGNDFEAQADTIKKRLNIYNVTKIIIDTTGIGTAVFQLVRKFFPAVIGIKFNIEIKEQMIIKTLSLMRSRRVEFDAGDKDFMLSFMRIKRTLTPKSQQITYTSKRNKTTSHSDLAWAAMMLFYQEPLSGYTTNSSIEVY